MLKLLITICLLTYILPSPTSPFSQGQEHLFFTSFVSPQSLSLELGDCLIHRSVRSLFSKDLLLKKNQLPFSIILKNQLISGIHEKAFLHLYSSYTIYILVTQILIISLIRRCWVDSRLPATPQLLSLHRKDTAEVILQSIVPGFFPWWDECLE